MNWRTKARIQSLLSRLPGGETLYYLMQRHITKSLPQSEAKFLEVHAIEMGHIAAYLRHCRKPIGDAVFYQFGAGWTMAGPLTFYAAGVNRQILVDIRRLIRPWLINLTARRLNTLDAARSLLRFPEPVLAANPDRAVAQMKQHWGIDYRAPADARWTGLPDESVDCITSTNTLEHIPARDIADILTECRRILRPGGIMSFRVDYQDHYSYFDKGVSAYHFLEFSDAEWQPFNPSLHYQNRMRHPQYLEIYKGTGFEVIEDHPKNGSDSDKAEIRTMHLADNFRGLGIDEIAIRFDDIILRKDPSFVPRQQPATVCRAA